MNSRQFFDKVSLMREAQKEYFRTRSHEVLRRSKALEAEIDQEIKRVNGILAGAKPQQLDFFNT